MNSIAAMFRLPVLFLFLAMALFFAVLSAYQQLKEINTAYWGAEGQEPQGTIYAVQTVQFNISNASMPMVAAQALLSSNYQFLQELTDSAYGLSGFVVTKCSQLSSPKKCIDEAPVAFTKLGNGWINSNNVHRFIETSDFSALWSDHRPGLPWRYRAPKNDSIIDMDFNHTGEVIGRIYYVRRPAPSFNDQFSSFLNNPWSSNSTATKYFMPVIMTHFFGFLMFSALAVACYRFIRAYRKADEEKRELERLLEEAQQNASLIQKDMDDLMRKFSKMNNRLKAVEQAKTDSWQQAEIFKSEIKEYSKAIANMKISTAEDNDLLVHADRELRLAENRRDKALKEYQEQVALLSSIQLEQSSLQEKLSEKDRELSDSKEEVERYKNAYYLRGNKYSPYRAAVKSFVDGLNVHAHSNIELHPAFIHDLTTLEKKNIPYERVNEVISRLVKIDQSDTGFSRKFQQLPGFDSVYHNKKAGLRIFFQRKLGKTRLLATWEQSDAPHSQSDPNWKVLKSREQSV